MERPKISNELRTGIQDAFGSKVKIELIQPVQAEIRADKVDFRLLLLSKHRCYVANVKLPLKVETSFHFLDISSLESKSQRKLAIVLSDGKKLGFGIDEDGKQLDQVVGHILVSLAGTFPAVPLERLIGSIDVMPAGRLKELTDKVSDIQQKASMNPCGNFSMAYQSMCDYFNVEFLDDVAWDIDTIYLSHDTKDITLSDFDHLIDGRQFVAIVSALEHNRWFTGFNCSDVKLNSSVTNELMKVIKSNTTLEQLILPNSAVRADFVQRLSLSVAANSSSSLNVIDLSDNLIEDKGVGYLCAPLSKLGHGLVKLKLSRAGLTATGINHLAEALQSNPNMLATLKYLDLSHNSARGEDLTRLYNFLAQPNALTRLILASIDAPLESLFATLLRGCTQNLAHLDVSGNYYSSRKQSSVPGTWQQFFASSCALKTINFASVRLPPEAVKSVLLGLTANPTLKDVELNLSGNALGAAGLSVLEVMLPSLSNVAVLDLSDNGFDSAMASVIGMLSQNRSIRKLAIGRNLNNVKQRSILPVMEALVALIQIEDSPIEHLSLDDMKLRTEITVMINALGLNYSLTYLDISGNQMGDFGARMLSKALQINKKLVTILWDHNGTSPAGFQFVATALEKNFTLKEMPIPVNDVAAALRVNQAKTEKALKTIEKLLHRNHCPQKFKGNQEYRLQQGFLASSWLQMDAAAVQIQETIQKLEQIGHVSDETSCIMNQGRLLLVDANMSRHLLLDLQKVAFEAENSQCSIWRSLREYAGDLNNVMKSQLEKTVCEMVQYAHGRCPAVLDTEELRQSILESCLKEINLPPNFVEELVIDQVGTEVLNKTTDIDLAVATHLSEKIIEDATNLLEQSYAKLTVALRKEAQSGGHLNGDSAESKEMRKCLLRTTTSSVADEASDVVDEKIPVVTNKRMTLYNRRLRPMSNIGLPDELASAPSDVSSPDHTGNTDSKQQPSSGLSNKPTTPKSKKPSDLSLNLLPLDSEAPKLQHLAADRPRRPKNRAITRPTVGIEMSRESEIDGENAAVDTGVNEFFSVPVDDSVSSSSLSLASPRVLNGDSENASKDAKKLKPQTSKSEGKGITGFMRGLIGRGKPSAGVKTEEPISKTSERSGEKSPSGTLEDSKKSPGGLLAHKHSFGAADDAKEKGAPATSAKVPVARATAAAPAIGTTDMISELKAKTTVPKDTRPEDDNPKATSSVSREGKEPPQRPVEKSKVVPSISSDGKEPPQRPVEKSKVVPSISSDGKEPPQRPVEKSKVVPNASSEGKEPTHLSASNGSESPRLQGAGVKETPAVSLSNDQETRTPSTVPSSNAKDQSVSSRLSTESGKDLTASFVDAVANSKDVSGSRGSTAIENDVRASSAPRFVSRAPPPLAPKPKSRQTVYNETPNDGASKLPPAKGLDGDREHLGISRASKLVEVTGAGDSESEKEELDRNSNVKRTNDFDSGSDSGDKIDSKEAPEVKITPVPAKRLTNVSKAEANKGDTKNETETRVVAGAVSDGQPDSEDDEMSSQPVFL